MDTDKSDINPAASRGPTLHVPDASALMVGSPLELLSNAAAAILETARSRDAEEDQRRRDLGTSSAACDESVSSPSSGRRSSTELSALERSPASLEIATKENKMKRSKDRREINANSSSYRLKRSASPQPLCIDEGSGSDVVLTPDQAHSPRTNSSPNGTRTLPSPDHLIASPMAAVVTATAINFAPQISSLYKRDRSSALAYRGSPYDANSLAISSADLHSTMLRRNSDPVAAAALLAAVMAGQQHAVAAVEPDDEQPLDFSKKSRNNSSESESRSLPRSDDSPSPSSHHHSSTTHPAASPLAQQMRPSVITCAPALLRTQMSTSPNCQSCGLSSEFAKFSPSDSRYAELSNHHSHCKTVTAPPPPLVVRAPPPPYSSYHENGRLHAAKTRKVFHPEIIRPEPIEKQKRPVISGVSDPDLEEHFRRSLGKDFPEMFSKSSPKPATVSTSVDDHFAKALGFDTWSRLNQKDDKEVETAKSKLCSPQSVVS